MSRKARGAKAGKAADRKARTPARDAAKPDPKERKEAEEAAAALQAREKEIEELRAKAEEYLDLARRTKADFLNYQDRVHRDKESWIKYAIEDFIREFLPALDAVRESVRSAADGAPAERLVEGVELIEKEFLRVLSKNGITPIEAEGRPFDPAFHEAGSVLEREDADPNTVIGVIRRGWMLHDRVLRPSLVVIARPPENQDAREEKAEGEDGEASEKAQGPEDHGPEAEAPGAGREDTREEDHP